MFLTKIWFILIAILLAVAVTIAVIAPRPVAKKMALLEGQRLDRAQYAAEQMFKVDAHKWIDRVGKLGRDAIISESLDAASRGSGEYTVIHRTIGDRFRTLIPDLSSGGIDVIAAVDNKGRVISRVGENDKEYGDYVAGAELIADALRGYLSDDVWGIGGKLQRVAAAPVLSKNRDRIVGAIYVGAETGDALVERLKKNLDVDVALILRGKVIASTRPGGSLDALPALIGQHARRGAVSGASRRAAGVLRARGRAAGRDRRTGAAIGNHVRRPQVGELPVVQARGRRVRDDRVRAAVAALRDRVAAPKAEARGAKDRIGRSAQGSRRRPPWAHRRPRA